MHISVSPSHPKDSDEDAGIQLMLTKVGVNLSALFSAKSSAPTASKFITKLSHLTMPPRTSDQAGSAAGLNAGVVVAILSTDELLNQSKNEQQQTNTHPDQGCRFSSAAAPAPPCRLGAKETRFLLAH